MAEVSNSLRSTLSRILVAPAVGDLWQLQSELLMIGGEEALKAREVAGAFHSFLRDLQSKGASRGASRWGAILETASVASVGLQEMLVEQEDPLRRIVASSVTGMLEVAAAAKNVEAWEVETSLVPYDVGWYLYGEMWEVSKNGRPELGDEERKDMMDRTFAPVMSPDVEGKVKSAVLLRLFMTVLAARVMLVLEHLD